MPSPTSARIWARACSAARSAFWAAATCFWAFFFFGSVSYTHLDVYKRQADLHLEMERSKRYARPLSLIVMDLDHFIFFAI